MDRCAACPWASTGEHNPVPGQGPRDARIMLIGEGPGKQESAQGLPFVGKSGRELDETYLPLAGLVREQCYVTNNMKCYPPAGKLKPDNKEHRYIADTCAATHLQDEIDRIQPDTVVTMGAWATRTLLGDIDLEMEHGIPVGNVFPTYHPAAGLHSPEMMTPLRDDFARLRLLLADALHLPHDEYPNPDYRIIDYAEVFDAMGDPTQVLAIDTETAPDRSAFCLTFSSAPGTGYMVLATDRVATSEFAARLSHRQAPILIHNSLFDLPVLRSLGVHVPWKWLRDTMVSAYHLGNVPQGLKALSWRYLGFRQKSFSDLVMPYARAEALTYLREAAKRDWPKPEVAWVLDKDGFQKPYKAKGIGGKLKLLFTHLASDPDIDIFERWGNWVADGSIAVVTRELGPFPIPSVTQVPLDQVVRYACADADVTLRLWPLLQRAARKMRHSAPSMWLTSF